MTKYNLTDTNSKFAIYANGKCKARGINECKIAILITWVLLVIVYFRNFHKAYM